MQCNVTFSIQHSWDVKVFFCNVEGQIEIFQWIVLKVGCVLKRSSYCYFQLKTERNLLWIAWSSPGGQGGDGG